MEKVWYILIDGKKEGPFSLPELKRHFRVTPDTLAWKEGFKEWVPIRHILELRDIFKDEEQPLSENEEEIKGKAVEMTPAETLAMRSDPPSFYFWLIIALLVLSYALYVFTRR